MDIVINNCNNIEKGNLTITEGALNIKYAVNGTGKSTVSKAIYATVKKSTSDLNELTPYNYIGNSDGHTPSVDGLDNMQSVKIFNDEYVDSYVYQADELIKDSFSIFVKTPDYDAHMQEIKNLLQEINKAFQDHPELDTLIQNFSQFVEGFGKAKSGYSSSGAIGKSLGKGNKITHIPHGLEAYEPYLSQTQNALNVKWLKWQMDGKTYLDIADQCPYCSGSIDSTKETILKVSNEYDSKSIEHLNKILSVFENLLPYFSDETAEKIKEISDNVEGITKPQQTYLIGVKEQVSSLLSQLQELKRIGFFSLKNSEKIADELKKYEIDLSYYFHLCSDLTKEKIEAINGSLKLVLEKAGRLQGEIAQQKNLIRKTIESNSNAINSFLQCAGYNYAVSIIETPNHDYKMILKPSNSENEVVSVKKHLSFGERNAFALVLFMFSALKEDPDLIILDDPISSFDGNKKFAIINMLFQSKQCFKNRTVLLLTHEFSTVIDVIYTMPYNFSPAPNAKFLTNKNGILSEKEITKENISSFKQIAIKNINEGIDTLNKLVYLRRLFVVDENKGDAWNLISNILHKRAVPIYRENDNEYQMSAAQIQNATDEIREYISDFDFHTEIAKVQNTKQLIELYLKSESNYEKLQLYRIIFNENSENRVVKKFVNETFHPENDYIFQLNPREYDTVPQYIIDICDEDVTILVSQQDTCGINITSTYL